jgi:2-iminobutanoate/2-iminopropanoate deaminase
MSSTNAPFQPITGPNVLKSALPFSAAVRSGDFLFVSGQASVDMQGNIVADTFEGEMRRTMKHIENILAAAGLTFRDVVQVRGYVDDKKDLPEYNRIYREFFTEPYPVRTTLLGCLAGVIKVEIDVTARLRS